MDDFLEEIKTVIRQTILQYANYALTEKTILEIRQGVALKLRVVIENSRLPWKIETSSLTREANWINAEMQIKDGDKIIFKINLRHEKESDHLDIDISPSRRPYSLGWINFV